MLVRVIVFALAIAAATEAEAQKPASWKPNVELRISAGWSPWPAADAFESAMRQHGFDDIDDADFLRPPEARPMSRITGNWLAEFRYLHHPGWGVAIDMGSTSADSYGYRSISTGIFGGIGEDLVVGSNVRTHAIAALLKRGLFSVQVGPARYRVQAWRNKSIPEDQLKTVNKFGALVGMGVESPAWHGLTLHGSVQYRAVGNARVGPFHAETGSLPDMTASFSHTYGGIGVGLRF